jgi:hypothetical protein
MARMGHLLNLLILLRLKGKSRYFRGFCPGSAPARRAEWRAVARRISPLFSP